MTTPASQRPQPTAPLDLRLVVGATFGLIRSDAAVLFAIALGFRAATIGIEQAQTLIAPGADALAVLARYFLTFLPFALGDVALVWVGVTRLAGVRPSLPAALRASLGLLAAAFVVDLAESGFDLVDTVLNTTALPAQVSAYADWAPIVFFLVNNAWLACLLPALAVAADEKTDAPRALVQGWRLTHGQRLRLFSLLMLTAIVQLGVPYLVASFCALAGFAAPDWLLEVVRLPVDLFNSLLQAVVYWELLRLREGVRRGDVERIFG